MRPPLTNVHIHIFNTDCAPQRFFRVLSLGYGNVFASALKSALDSKAGRSIVNRLAGMFNTETQRKVARYISFMRVGGLGSQQEIFEQALAIGKKFDPSIRMIALTLNMDHMDSERDVRKSFETQLEEVRNIRRYYPRNFFPFLGIDPYHKAGIELKEWAQHNFESGFLRNGEALPYFFGIKLYPAHGFFPFDRALEELYAYAEEYNLPIISHCTRSGSMYIGDDIEDRIPKFPLFLNPTGSKREKEATQRIHSRIQRFYKAELIKNNALGNNDQACDLFSHPENFIPVLEKFPNLKVCLAHMGGLTEFLEYTAVPKDIQRQRDLEQNGKWLDLIQTMMRTYPNLYTDISYTLSGFDQPAILNTLGQFLGDPADPQALGKRVLFGTDFFMTEQEKKESDLYALLIHHDKLKPWMDDLTRHNPARFLSNMNPYIGM